MPRVYPAHRISPAELKQRVSRQFGGDLLAPFRRQLLELVEQHDAAIAEGSKQAFGAIESLLTYYESLMPSTPAERFTLDAWVIQNIAESWSVGPMKLPATILPLYGNHWSWQQLRWFKEADGTGHRVYGLTLKGRDNLSSIELLEYPWLCHELGHGLFTVCLRKELDSFAKQVDEFCRPMLLKTFADSSEVRALTEANADRIRQHWRPRSDQHSWFHEIAVDVFALWSCGPAFLSSMHDVASSGHIDPFLTNSEHPPYALRTKILVDASRELGWAKEIDPLASLCKNWDKEKLALTDHNRYAAVADPTLAEAVLRWSLSLCRRAKMPRCDRGTLREISERRSSGASVESAAELVISAWLMFEEDRDRYAAWEYDVVRSLSAELNGNT